MPYMPTLHLFVIHSLILMFMPRLSPTLILFTAGYNVVIVESVGLGQSEVEIDNAVDMLVMIVPPGGGDGLQVRHCSFSSHFLTLLTLLL